MIELPHVHRGKVRDLYDAGDGLLLMVASDRISAFDVVMDEPVPDKGRVLTAMSAHWFEQVGDVVGNHLVSTDVSDLPAGALRSGAADELAGRVMLCRRAEMIPVECIVRGFVAGSAWKEYRSHGTIHGMPAPAGLVEADRLPEPLFTPSTKAAVGDHDENISFDRAVELLGGEIAEQAREVSLAIFARASERAEAAGFLLADTKFELGFVTDADTDAGSAERSLVLADEVLTPDSSRYWAADDWTPGATPQGYDKQPVRDFLESLDWDKTPPPPPLPAAVVAATAQRYRAAYERICGRSLDDWPGAPA